MDGSRIDTVTRLFAEHRLTRRQALAQGGAGLAAAGVIATGLAAGTSAQQATPASQGATPVPTDTSDHHKTAFLFLQSFQSGSIVPKEGAAGTWSLTLAQGLGQTVYFSDRPERIVGVSPTDQFLKGLGFLPDNPPNAALLFANDQGEEDISVVELFNPTYDTATHTATYDIKLLEEYARLGMTLQQQPTEPPEARAAFGAAHLFIDDCPDYAIFCEGERDDGSTEIYYTFSNDAHDGFCYSWGSAQCLPCRPWYSDLGQAVTYWTTQCAGVLPSDYGSYRGCLGACDGPFEFL